ncbi:DnaK protein (Hsp70) [Methanothermobacter thermautotrophicus str. Delta H]|uniref:Chaperone protein DnaK n=1 Tax=Methanothermobacter thermautotrophicus (strain ATCC 29096 / DSM 1053 / JCM 10044 / NBRC 100330 / Delta H) TaxID=187420 RepID=DNAK_METTH|nr:RecName: Full=Chaperone protein DnaK; AltName: Full=HSP70; AltName: Full=Heat shock 70 kDa protein; AltName: Full=Heat shock protein 70 [Methanothermobacter thermautotrophicus str. Delta H]AAB85772.1 DnaK protein (Hsp70) [Methanothermobacter thermautotrophicus str. Delta H]
MAKKEKILGIDLGTSNSAAAVLIGGKPTIIPSAEGASQYGKSFPSCVAFTEDGQMLVGEPARRQAVTNPENTITAIKRSMGTDRKVKVHGKEYTPQEISAFILQKIKKDAEAFLGEEIKKAVITVPAYFDDNQRTATKDAGTIAGLDVVRLVNEPTAASLAYGLDKEDEDMVIMVFDLGGGTLDVTIMEFGGGVFEVRSTSGDTQLGGTDMDNAIMNYLAEEFKMETGIDLMEDDQAVQRLREAAEKAKIELSTTLTTEVNLPYITVAQDGPKHLIKTITRAKLEELVDPIVQKCAGPMEQALRDAGMTREDVDKIILVGGPTRMPIVQKFVEDFIGKPVERGIDPMECVAMGAAIQGGVLAGEIKDLVLLDVTPLSLGIETLGGVFTKLIERNTTIPTRKSQIFSTAADNQTSVDIHVLQGERPMAADNTSLGRFQLVGIPPAPRGVPQIEVTFDIDANGILNVSAKDLGTGKEQAITITAPNKLSEEEIKQKIEEAKKHAEEDRRKQEEIEIRNNADSMIYTAEKTLDELGDKVPAEKKEEVEKQVRELRELIAGDDIQAIKSKTEELTKTVQEIGVSYIPAGSTATSSTAAGR